MCGVARDGLAAPRRSMGVAVCTIPESRSRGNADDEPPGTYRARDGCPIMTSVLWSVISIQEE